MTQGDTLSGGFCEQHEFRGLKENLLKERMFELRVELEKVSLRQAEAGLRKHETAD